MREGAFLLLYGLLFISGAFMTFAWGKVALDAHASRRLAVNRDRYLLVSSMLTLNSIATMGLFGTRLAAAFMHEVFAVPGILGNIILGMMALFELSKIGLVYAVGLNPAAASWRAYAVISLVWTLFAIGWSVT